MKGYDIVMDGTTIKLNGLSTRCIAEAGCHGVNLNGFGEENESHAIFVQNENMFAWVWYDARCNANDGNACSKSTDTVESVRVSHGSYRPIAFLLQLQRQRHMNMIHIYHRVQCMKMVNLNKYFRLRVREK